MRIVGGEVKGHRLSSPKIKDIRPTTDRVREALFNLLQGGRIPNQPIEDSIFIDFFCGSGAVGIEALSRGAKHCYFIDQNPLSLKLTKENLNQCHLLKKATLIKAKHKFIPPSQDPVTHIFLDPPYDKNLIPEAIDKLFTQGWMNEETLIIVETSHQENINMPDYIKVLSSKTYGNTKIGFYCMVK